MKLAEALSLCADHQKRLEQLKTRMLRNARIQEGQQSAGVFANPDRGHRRDCGRDGVYGLESMISRPTSIARNPLLSGTINSADKGVG